MRTSQLVLADATGLPLGARARPHVHRHVVGDVRVWFAQHAEVMLVYPGDGRLRDRWRCQALALATTKSEVDQALHHVAVVDLVHEHDQLAGIAGLAPANDLSNPSELYRDTIRVNGAPSPHTHIGIDHPTATVQPNFELDMEQHRNFSLRLVPLDMIIHLPVMLVLIENDNRWSNIFLDFIYGVHELHWVGQQNPGKISR